MYWEREKKISFLFGNVIHVHTDTNTCMHARTHTHTNTWSTHTQILLAWLCCCCCRRTVLFVAPKRQCVWQFAPFITQSTVPIPNHQLQRTEIIFFSLFRCAVFFSIYSFYSARSLSALIKFNRINDNLRSGTVSLRKVLVLFAIIWNPFEQVWKYLLSHVDASIADLAVSASSHRISCDICKKKNDWIVCCCSSLSLNSLSQTQKRVFSKVANTKSNCINTFVCRGRESKRARANTHKWYQ